MGRRDSLLLHAPIIAQASNMQFSAYSESDIVVVFLEYFLPCDLEHHLP
jgi:hypothetical protein